MAERARKASAWALVFVELHLYPLEPAEVHGTAACGRFDLGEVGRILTRWALFQWVNRRRAGTARLCPGCALAVAVPLLPAEARAELHVDVIAVCRLAAGR